MPTGAGGATGVGGSGVGGAGGAGTGGAGMGGAGTGTGGAGGSGGSAMPACPKPAGGICHEFIANDNANNKINYVNEFTSTKPGSSSFCAASACRRRRPHCPMAAIR